MGIFNLLVPFSFSFPPGEASLHSFELVFGLSMKMLGGVRF